MARPTIAGRTRGEQRAIGVVESCTHDVGDEEADLRRAVVGRANRGREGVHARP